VQTVFPTLGIASAHLRLRHERALRGICRGVFEAQQAQGTARGRRTPGGSELPAKPGAVLRRVQHASGPGAGRQHLDQEALLPAVRVCCPLLAFNNCKNSLQGRREQPRGGTLYSSATRSTTLPPPCPDSSLSCALATSFRGTTSSTSGRTWPRSIRPVISSSRLLSRVKKTP